MTAHAKFFLFDAGVYRTIRPAGPLDRPEEIDGAALDNARLPGPARPHRIVYRALDLYTTIYTWRTAAGAEVDFIAYGGDGLFAIEVKRRRKIRQTDLHALRQFKLDYPMARCVLLFTPRRRRRAAVTRTRRTPRVPGRHRSDSPLILLPVAEALADPTLVLA